jgi:hypothetical protein
MDSNRRVTHPLLSLSSFLRPFQALSTSRFQRVAFFSRIFPTILVIRPSRSSRSNFVGNTGFVLSLPLRPCVHTVMGKNQNVRQFILAPFWTVLSAVAAGNASRPPHCRFHMTFEGFEWFLYNRTAAFDNIVSQMEARTPVPERRTQSFGSDGAAFHLRQFFGRSPATSDRASRLFFSSLNAAPESHLAVHVQTPRVLGISKLLRNFTQWLRSQLPDLDSKDLLPLSFEGLNGGIVLGNMATSNVLVAEFSRADGMFGTVPVCRFTITCFPPNGSYV